MAQCASVLHLLAFDLRPFVSNPVIGSLSTSGKILAPKVVHKSLKETVKLVKKNAFTFIPVLKQVLQLTGAIDRERKKLLSVAGMEASNINCQVVQ